LSRQYDIKTHSRQSSVTLKGKCCSVRGIQLFLLKLPWQPTNSHGQLPPPPFLFLLLRLLSNIQEGMYWNNNSILSLAERSGVESSSRCMNCYPQGWQPPEPTVPDLLSSREKSTPKKTISTIQEWVTCFNAYISLIWVRQPACVPVLLAYSSIIVRASGQCVDAPWLSYDAQFRREAATRPGTPWAVIDSSIWTLRFSRATPVPKSEVKTNAGVMNNQPCSMVAQALEWWMVNMFVYPYHGICQLGMHKSPQCIDA